MKFQSGGYTDMSDNQKEAVILCAASSYEQKYYLNQDFAALPETIREELQIMCVLFTADVGGILTLQFDEDGNLLLNVTSEENDFMFDEIGSVLKVKQIQAEKRELLEGLEMYYKVKFLGQDLSEM